MTSSPITPLLALGEDSHHEWAQILHADPSKPESDLEGVVLAVTIIAQSQYEHATDYADVET
ncbi:hypothetical protein [Halocatena marina]|uniref:Uncharacterized protein n=1 Tax=Halocatena marina TaxID=2934937 RepID=A0ABD5YYE5_9EURY|nr:hypothetical protein [Halocatena marina]